MTEIREGYKETEIGIIPEDWEVKKLEECQLKIVGGGTPPRSKKEYYNGKIPWVTVKDLDGSFYKSDAMEYVTEDAINNSATNLIDEGKVIIATRMGLGRGFINSKPLAINQDLKAIYLKKDITSEFFLNWFLSKANQLESLGTGTTVKGIRLETLKSLILPIPPLKEQEKIAEILSSTDKHIEDLDRLIEDYELLKKGMMQKLLTEGIGHTEFKDTEIGKIPKEWEVKRIGDLSEIITGKTPPTKKAELYGSLYPWVTPSDINHRRNINSTERMLSESGFESTSAKLPENTLLVTCIASIGKNAILKRDGSCNQQINAILPNNEVFSTSYLYYWVNQNKDYLISFSGQTAVPILNKTTFKSVLLALPPLAEQKKIASILSSIDDHINQLKDTKYNYTNLKQALMDRLLTGKIRVV